MERSLLPSPVRRTPPSNSAAAPDEARSTILASALLFPVRASPVSGRPLGGSETYGCGVIVVIICVSLFVTLMKAQIGGV